MFGTVHILNDTGVYQDVYGVYLLNLDILRVDLVIYMVTCPHLFHHWFLLVEYISFPLILI